MNKLRYQNHLSLENFNQETQEKISQSCITIFGIGGLGSVCSLYLSNAGVGKINLVDFDTVDETNLPRQIIYRPDQIGTNKALAAQETLNSLNPETKISAISERIMGDRLEKIVNDSDLVIDATDNLSSRLQINDACRSTKTKHVIGTAIRFEGQVIAFDHAKDESPCLNSVYSLMDESLEDCDGAGVLSTVTGTIGMLIANSALKVIMGKEKYNEMLVLDLQHNIFQKVSVKMQDN
ncbi:MAG: hypothetical protein CMQ73_05595 [Gammaproteobacteria bacterium]|nr:hypothetical protein [Gammaproteobacteria bacterium]OUT93674.1 MAG: hypothetical protein CBB96_07280 [Gammaproteobacteria bacterium TMED36]|tara:strand:- start:895 stop:1605 length:711 start_codon:yes stop_codon:yes gene_type:complete